MHADIILSRSQTRMAHDFGWSRSLKGICSVYVSQERTKRYELSTDFALDQFSSLRYTFGGLSALHRFEAAF